jgi:hypothetical protein
MQLKSLNVESKRRSSDKEKSATMTKDSIVCRKRKSTQLKVNGSLCVLDRGLTLVKGSLALINSITSLFKISETASEQIKTMMMSDHSRIKAQYRKQETTVQIHWVKFRPLRRRECAAPWKNPTVANPFITIVHIQLNQNDLATLETLILHGNETMITVCRSTPTTNSTA